MMVIEINELTIKTDNKKTEKEKPIIKKLTVKDLQTLDITPGFIRWVESSGEKGKSELRQFLGQRLTEGADILVATQGNKIIGFAIVVDWPTLPNAKALDAMEIAQPYRKKGIGSMLVKKIIEEWDTLIALIPSPEPGRERDLERFYEKFGFRHIAEDAMVLLPKSDDKLKRWVVYLQRLLYVYDSLLKEMKTVTEKERESRTQ
ncbi:MAG: GNAT family N-acetyltransferase [Candidatus Methylarchaceae archaeon HK02M2]|nr:GNAT family N-acetyltransferase [Candidatus Methylarchaceae archaeon HK02M2]